MQEQHSTPITYGIKVPVVLTTWAMHGSGQVWVKPGVTFDAGIKERQTFPLSDLEYRACRDTLPKPGEYLEAGTELIPDLLVLDYPVEIVSVDADWRDDEQEWHLRFEWLRWVLDYSGFKVKGLGLKGSMMPWIEPGTASTDPWALFPEAQVLVNLEGAKGKAITLAMFAESREGGLAVGPDGLDAETQAAYDAWWEANVSAHTVRHLITSSLVPYYKAAGHTVVKLDGQLYVEQTVECLTGTLTMEIEAPLVPHRTTMSTLSLVQAMFVAQDNLLA